MRCTVSGEEPTNPDNAPTPTDATRPDGQKVDHWVMCPGEIIKAGFKRPVRTKYQHVGPLGPKHQTRPLTAEETARWVTPGDPHAFVCFEPYPSGGSDGRYWSQFELNKVAKGGCGTVTSMPMAIAETYAAEPGFYGKTFCCGCNAYLPVGERGEFVWDGTNDRVGT